MPHATSNAGDVTPATAAAGVVRDATPADLDALLPLVRAFYAQFGYPYSEDRKAPALGRILSDPALGRVLLVEAGGAAVGYAVLAFSFSLEYDGRTAFVDELFVAEAARGLGLGTLVLRRAAELCREAGVNALHLETEEENEGAARLYGRLGFRSYGRRLMTLLLAPIPGPKP
jgi:ribosomal protein S18 acetylase RimI-like enzyme